MRRYFSVKDSCGRQKRSLRESFCHFVSGKPHFIFNLHFHFLVFLFLYVSVNENVTFHFRYRNFRTFASPRPCQFSCLALDSSGEVICAGSVDTFEIFMWSMQTGRLLEVIAYFFYRKLIKVFFFCLLK